jgi:hypothetical protein
VLALLVAGCASLAGAPDPPPSRPLGVALAAADELRAELRKADADEARAVRAWQALQEAMRALRQEAYLEAQGIFGRLQMDLMGASAPLESLQQRLPLVESLAGKLREAARGPAPSPRS